MSQPRSNRKRTLVLVALAAIVAVALPLAAAVGAANRPTLPPLGNGALLERAAQRLELTPQQRLDIKAILVAHKAEVERELQAIKSARGKLWDAIHASDPSDQAIRSAADAVGKAEGDLALTRAEIVGEVRDVLTAEQEQELQAIAGDFRAFLDTFLERLHDRVDALLGS